MRLGQKRRRAGNEEPHPRGQRTVKPRIVEQAGVEGRHPHQHARPRHLGDQRLEVEARQPDHPRPRQKRDVRRDKEPMRVKDGQRMQKHILGPEPPEIGEHLGVRQKVALRQHRPLRAPRGARGIEKRREIIRVPRDGREGRGHRGRGLGQAAPARGIEREHLRACRGRMGRDRLGPGGVDDHDARRGVGDEIARLGRRIGGVERQEHRPRRERRAIEREEGRRFRDLHHHPLARGHARRPERARDARRLRRDLGARDRAAAGQQQHPIAPPGEGREQRIIKRVGHGLRPQHSPIRFCAMARLRASGAMSTCASPCALPQSARAAGGGPR